MPVPAAGLGYLRFLLRAETDGILAESKRAAPTKIPEPREIRALLKILIGRGVRRIRLTGDDPAQRADLIDVVAMISGMAGVSSVTATTRGIGLDERVGALVEAGLRGVNFHLNTLRPERYEGGGREAEFAAVWRAIEACLAAGITVKVNTVLERDVNSDELADFVDLTASLPIDVRFVEWNVDIDLIPPPERFIPTWELMSQIGPPLQAVGTSEQNGPALIFKAPDHQGAIGFIPNVSDHFCSECHRMGLTDAGEIVSCVFGRGLDVMRHLRGENGIADAETFIDRVIRRKTSLAAKLAGFERPAMMAPSASDRDAGRRQPSSGL
ncbi:MAG: radical SAM protein [Candidatus Eisenbacteria bacterium]